MADSCCVFNETSQVDPVLSENSLQQVFIDLSTCQPVVEGCVGLIYCLPTQDVLQSISPKLTGQYSKGCMAIKVPRMLTHSAMIKRKSLQALKNESRILSGLPSHDHRNIITLRGEVLVNIGNNSLVTSLVFDWAYGGDVESLLSSTANSCCNHSVASSVFSFANTSPSTRLLSYASQLASAIHFLHSKAGLIHGDVRARNCLLMDTQQSHLMLADFDKARLVKCESHKQPLFSQHVDLTKAFIHPPEGIWTQSSDIYCFGFIILRLTMWTLLLRNYSRHTCLGCQLVTTKSFPNDDCSEQKIQCQYCTSCHNLPMDNQYSCCQVAISRNSDCFSKLKQSYGTFSPKLRAFIDAFDIRSNKFKQCNQTIQHSADKHNDNDKQHVWNLDFSLLYDTLEIPSVLMDAELQKLTESLFTIAFQCLVSQPCTRINSAGIVDQIENIYLDT